MNEDTSTNDAAAADDQEAPAEEAPKSMDEIIEQEAEADLDEERDEVDESEESEEVEDEAEEEVEEEPEEEEVEEEEAEPIDTTSFSQVGLDAVPEDYKPTSWQAFMKDMVEVVRGEVNKESTKLTQAQQAFQSEVQTIDQGWQSEIDELVKGGQLDKDPEAQQKVFEYMAENNQKHASNPNKQIWSFETAFKLMNANKVTDQRKEEIKTRRRARAGATASQGNSDGGSGIPRVTKGMSLDDIIASELDM